MDVTVPEIPAKYDAYRERLRAFLAEHTPTLEWRQRSGLRVPERASDVEALRTFTRAVYDAGYVLERFTMDPVDPFEQRILERELAGTGLPYILGNPLVSGAIKLFGTSEQQRKCLPPMARGEHIWTQLFSEPNAGSDLASLQTRARLEGDQYVIDGQKVWSTWAQWSDYGYLLARTENVGGSKGISAFILDMHSAGVQTRPLREMTGTTDFNEVFFDGVRLPAANLIGERGDGWRIANASLAMERSGVGAGTGVDSMQKLVRLARDAKRGGHPAIADTAARQDLARLAARARIQRYLGYSVATRAANGELSAADAPMTKIWFSELNLAQCELALELLGPRSAIVEGDPSAYDDGRWQDAFLYARAWTIAGGSNEIMRNLIAERGLGLPREPRGG
jgi:alkylation response protein AidB-like acyl-CoA dehydrogenase